MKAPKVINTYCPKCNAKTPHTVSIYRKGKESSLSRGARHHEWELHGYGGQKFPEQKRKAKTTTKQLLKLKCRQCGYTLDRLGVRLRKLELA
ncbi:50S ribosomal protein L44e [Candidatus Bathyarchaeota archaeon]|nr:50S ribosomal protein L44e [Candidatus Bathyarchaeota archaeon]